MIGRLDRRGGAIWHCAVAVLMLCGCHVQHAFNAVVLARVILHVLHASNATLLMVRFSHRATNLLVGISCHVVYAARVIFRLLSAGCRRCAHQKRRRTRAALELARRDSSACIVAAARACRVLRGARCVSTKDGRGLRCEFVRKPVPTQGPRRVSRRPGHSLTCRRRQRLAVPSVVGGCPAREQARREGGGGWCRAQGRRRRGGVSRRRCLAGQHADKEGCVVSSDSQQSNRSVTFVVRNATLLPCTWLASRGGSQCEHAPTIRLSAEMGSTTVTQLRHEQRLCRDRYFNDNLVKLRGDALLLSSSPSEQLPLSPDTDLVILVDAFGLSSIYHSTIDLLLPVAATARGTRSPSSRAVACSAAISKAGPIRQPQRPMSFARRSAARRLNLRSITRQAAWRAAAGCAPPQAPSSRTARRWVDSLWHCLRTRTGRPSRSRGVCVKWCAAKNG